jgi:hypothetical protein
MFKSAAGTDFSGDHCIGRLFLRRSFALAAANDQKGEKEPRENPKYRLHHCSVHRFSLLFFDWCAAWPKASLRIPSRRTAAPNAGKPV